jgi:hypothetical protein
MTSQLFLPIVRHALQALAGALVAQGYLDASMTEAVIGLGVSAFTLAWWGIERSIKQREEAGDE